MECFTGAQSLIAQLQTSLLALGTAIPNNVVQVVVLCEAVVIFTVDAVVVRMTVVA